jgi:hypothetical protein
MSTAKKVNTTKGNDQVSVKETKSTPVVNPLDKVKIEAGLLGKIFGTSPTGDNSINNIIGFCALLLILVIAYILIFKSEEFNAAINIFAPMITTILGYLMGSKMRK